METPQFGRNITDIFEGTNLSGIGIKIRYRLYSTIDDQHYIRCGVVMT